MNISSKFQIECIIIRWNITETVYSGVFWNRRVHGCFSCTWTFLGRFLYHAICKWAYFHCYLICLNFVKGDWKIGSTSLWKKNNNKKSDIMDPPLWIFHPKNGVKNTPICRVSARYFVNETTLGGHLQLIRSALWWETWKKKKKMKNTKFRSMVPNFHISAQTPKFRYFLIVLHWNEFERSFIPR